MNTSKALPAQHPQGIGRELAAGFGTADLTQPLLQFSLQQLQNNFLQGEKTYFPGRHIPISVMLQPASWGGRGGRNGREDQGGGEDQGGPAAAPVPESFWKPLLPPAADLQPTAGWLLSSQSEYSAPQRRRADSPGYSISLRMEETAGAGQAAGMEPSSRRRGCPANAPCPCSGGDNSSRCCESFGSCFEAWKEAATSDMTSWMLFSKGSDTTASHMPECQVTLWKWSWEVRF